MEAGDVKWARRSDLEVWVLRLSVGVTRGGQRPGQRVVVDAWSRLICAGWVPQDRVFGGNGAAGLVIERGHGPRHGWCGPGCS